MIGVTIPLPSQTSRELIQSTHEQVSRSWIEVECEARKRAYREGLLSMIEEGQEIAESENKPLVAARTKNAAIELNLVLSLLIKQIDVPEFGILLDGGIGLEWFGKDEKSLTVSSIGFGKLVFSGWFGGPSHWRGYFNPRDSKDLDTLLSLVKRVLNEE